MCLNGLPDYVTSSEEGEQDSGVMQPVAEQQQDNYYAESMKYIDAYYKK